MSTTPRLGLPFIEAAQAQKHVTHNDALAIVDALVHLAVHSRVLSVPPGSPAEGDAYIVAAVASGDWSGWEGRIATYRDGAWLAIVPVPGAVAWVRAERVCVTFEDGAWRAGAALTAHGGAMMLRAKEEELTLSGAVVETADAAFLPDRAIVFGVAARTTQAITGATSFDVGIAGDPGKFGGSLGISLGAANIGVIGPAAVYADTKVRATANGSDFTGGKVRLIAYFAELTAPSD